MVPQETVFFGVVQLIHWNQPRRWIDVRQTLVVTCFDKLESILFEFLIKLGHTTFCSTTFIWRKSCNPNAQNSYKHQCWSRLAIKGRTGFKLRWGHIWFKNGDSACRNCVSKCTFFLKKAKLQVCLDPFLICLLYTLSNWSHKLFEVALWSFELVFLLLMVHSIF